MEEKIDAAEVGLESLLLGKDLVIGTGLEAGGAGMLGADGLAQVIQRGDFLCFKR